MKYFGDTEPTDVLVREAFPPALLPDKCSDVAVPPTSHTWLGAGQPLGFWMIWAGFVLFALLVRWQTLGNPVVGFDEQFYLLVGDRMWPHAGMAGAVPYVDIWDRKPVGLFVIFAAIRALGGEGFVQYKLVATLFAATTASLIAKSARGMAGAVPISRAGALTSGALYLIWLNFTECEGGQADVFFALPMVLAGGLSWAAWRSGEHVTARGCTAMGLVGLALQIKYSVVIEGMFFGLTILAARHRQRRGAADMLRLALVLIACALAPTALVCAWYWHIGHFYEFVFANFLSQFGRNPLPAGLESNSYAEIAGILLPLAVLCGLAWRRAGRAIAFPLAWTFACLLGMVVLGNVGSSHYAAAVLVPATIACAAAFGDGKRSRRWAVGVTLLFFVVAQVVLWRVAALKGGTREAAQVAAAAVPGKGCIYVYDGYPGLYMLTHSCLPTRWAFPGHLNTFAEAATGAIGVDPLAEEARVLASRPKAIIDDDPVYEGGNPANHALLEAAVRRDYYLAARVPTGGTRFRLVYRRKGD